MRLLSEVIRTRQFCGRHFEMQVVQIRSGEDAGKYQATYYHGAQEMVVAEVGDTMEQAADKCDEYLDNLIKKHQTIN